MAKYLNYSGLQTFWAKIKTWVASAVTTGSPSSSKTVTGWNDGHMTFGNIQIDESQVTDLQTHLGQKAPVDSPTFTGTPSTTTPPSNSDNTRIPTTEWVRDVIDAKMEESNAMIYKSTIDGGSNNPNAYGALTPSANKGWTYIVSTAGYIDGVAVEVGDMLICNTDSTAAATASNYSTIVNNWDFIQSNIDGAVRGPSSAVDERIAVFNGATGKLIKDGGKKVSELATAAQGSKADTAVQSVKMGSSSGTELKDGTNVVIPNAVATGSTGATSGLMTADDKKKLNDLPANADLTTALAAKEDVANKVTEVRASSSATDTAYPSERAVATAIENINQSNADEAEVVAAALNDLDARLKAIESDDENLGDVVADSINVQTLLLGGEDVGAMIGGKADKVSNATNNHFAALDSNGNLKDSGKQASDFATAAQGAKADSAIQGVKVNNTSLTPSSGVVNIPAADTSNYGVVKFMTSAEAAQLWDDAWTAATAS